MKNNKSFIQAILLTIVTIVGFTGLINFIVDPFDTFQLIEFEGLNRNKPAMYTNNSVAKARLVNQLKPVSLVLGNSRSEVGINPESTLWHGAGHPRFNLSLASGDIADALTFLKFANAIQPVKHVILTTDFLMFKANRITDENREIKRKARLNEFYTDDKKTINWFYSLFTLDALKASLHTLGIQDMSKDYSYKRNGMRSYRILEEEHLRSGHRQMFKKSEEYFKLSKFYQKLDNDYYLFSPTSRTAPGLDAFQALVDMCHQNEIDLAIIISPIHARLLDLIKENGNWLEFENWKRTLVDIAHNANQKRAAEKQITLWDFSGYNAITMEKIPVAGDNKTKMQWYWEASHYKEITGDMILRRIFSHQLPATVPNDFGILLSKDNIEMHIKRSGARKHGVR